MTYPRPYGDGLPARQPIASDIEEATRLYDAAYADSWKSDLTDHREKSIQAFAVMVMMRRQDMARKAFVPTYRGGGQDCPGCGRSQWNVGRSMAECGFCSTAIPIGRRAA